MKAKPETLNKIILRVNSIGKKQVPSKRFTCVNVSKTYPLKVTLKHTFSGEEKITAPSNIIYLKKNPWNNFVSDNQRIRRINKLGKKWRKELRFFCTHISVKGHKRICHLQRLSDGSTEMLPEINILYENKNPWGSKTHHSASEKMNIVDKIGKSFPKDKQFLCIKIRVVNKVVLATLKHIESGDIAEVNYSALVSRKQNPWRFLTAHQIIDRNTKIGMSFEENKFICIKVAGWKKNNRMIVIKHLKSGKTLKVSEQNIYTQKSNPWGENVPERLEENIIHPKYAKLFKNLNVKFDHEVRLHNGKRIDFVVHIPRYGKLGVEVKRDDRPWTTGSRSAQMENYRMKQNGFRSVVMTSPKGRYGYSLEDLKKLILSKIP